MPVEIGRDIEKPHPCRVLVLHHGHAWQGIAHGAQIGLKFLDALARTVRVELHE